MGKISIPFVSITFIRINRAVEELFLQAHVQSLRIAHQHISLWEEAHGVAAQSQYWWVLTGHQAQLLASQDDQGSEQGKQDLEEVLIRAKKT